VGKRPMSGLAGNTWGVAAVVVDGGVTVPVTSLPGTGSGAAAATGVADK